MPPPTKQANASEPKDHRIAPAAAKALRTSEKELSRLRTSERITILVMVVGLLALPFSYHWGRDWLAFLSILVLFQALRLVNWRKQIRLGERSVELSRDSLASATRTDEELQPFWEEWERQSEELRLFAKQLISELADQQQATLWALPGEDARLSLVKEIERAQEVYDQRVLRLEPIMQSLPDHFLEQLESTLGVTRFGYRIPSTAP